MNWGSCTWASDENEPIEWSFHRVVSFNSIKIQEVGIFYQQTTLTMACNF